MKKKQIFLTLLFSIVLIYTAFAQSGSLDLSFDPGTGANNAIYATAVQSDGKIIIGGDFTTFNGLPKSRIVRLNTNGSLDYFLGAGANNTIYSIAVQNDGKIIVAGDFTSYNGSARNRIVRLNSDGTLDPAFYIGTGTDNTILTIAIQNDGKIIIGGYFITYNGIARYGIARLNSDGSLDETFNPGYGVFGVTPHVKSIAIQNDGKILIGGEFGSYNGTDRKNIARINTDGSLDVTFVPGYFGVLGRVKSIVIQNDGKILIGGVFTSYNGIARNNIARINSDGSNDATFNPGTGADNTVFSISIQSTGKILIGGTFTSYNGTARNRIARLNSDGSLDAGFNPGAGASYYIYSTSLQSDGKIIIGGDFTSYNGTTRNRIARILNNDIGINENDNKNDFKIYPNPATDILTIEITGKNTGTSQISIFNAKGQELKTLQLTEASRQISISDLQAGLYFIKLVNAENIGVCKFIKK